MATYIDTDEISVFGIVVRVDGTLCGYATKTGRYAAIGGGMTKAQKGNIFKAFRRELRQEVFGKLKLVLADGEPVIFYVDSETKCPVKAPKQGQKVKLHIYLIFHEISGSLPMDGRPEEIAEIAFRPTAFFEEDMASSKAVLLRPSLHYALKKFRKRGLWPALPLPSKPVTLKVGFMLHRLTGQLQFNTEKAKLLTSAVSGKTF